MDDEARDVETFEKTSQLGEAARKTTGTTETFFQTSLADGVQTETTETFFQTSLHGGVVTETSYQTSPGTEATIAEERYRGYRVETTRLRDWDYRNEGLYFVTICTSGRAPWFGEIRDGVMHLSEVGRIAAMYWQAIPEHHVHVLCDQFVVMPDHVHGILALTGNDADRSNVRKNVSGPRNIRTQPDVLSNVSTNGKVMSRISPPAQSLSVVVRSYKSAVTRWCKQNGPPEFAWQERFYDHVIRNQDALDKIRRYVDENPLRWDEERRHLAPVWL